MPDLLKNGTSASREETAEEMKEYRLTTYPWCPSTVIPEDGPSLFHDRLKPRSHHILPECPWTTQNPIYVFSKPLLMARLYSIHFSYFRVGEKRGTPSESFWNSIGFGFYILYLFIYSSMIFVTNFMSEKIHLLGLGNN